jgi:hypothetical protein
MGYVLADVQVRQRRKYDDGFGTEACCSCGFFIEDLWWVNACVCWRISGRKAWFDGGEGVEERIKLGQDVDDLAVAWERLAGVRGHF